MSSGDDWDASDEEAAKPVAPSLPAVVKGKGRFADEDVEEDVKESWEDSDDEKPTSQSQPASAAPVRQKGITKAKIAEREAAEAARLKEIEERNNQDPLEKKKQERLQQLSQDLENARSLFGDATLAAATNGIAAGDDVFAQHPNPKSVKEFEDLSTALAKKIADSFSTKPLYATFVKHLIRELAVSLPNHLDIKEAASTLTAIGNEKQKAATGGGAKKGKKGKPQLGTVGGAGGAAKNPVAGRGYAADLEIHDTALDMDDDDFM